VRLTGLHADKVVEEIKKFEFEKWCDFAVITKRALPSLGPDFLPHLVRISTGVGVAHAKSPILESLPTKKKENSNLLLRPSECNTDDKTRTLRNQIFGNCNYPRIKFFFRIPWIGPRNFVQPSRYILLVCSI